ncbi:MAG: caa(3)-type oxidase subunit IV [Candidatus Omnitrophota bacterium]|jgi:caa(3)-type oxidase subunit IV
MSKDIEKDIKKYKIIYVTLLALTVVTVAVSYLEVPVWGAVVIALIVATIKSSTVAAFFMHLLHEKKTILWILASTMLCMITMIVLIIASQYSLFDGLYYTEKTLHKPAQVEVIHASEVVTDGH